MWQRPQTRASFGLIGSQATASYNLERRYRARRNNKASWDTPALQTWRA